MSPVFGYLVFGFVLIISLVKGQYEPNDPSLEQHELPEWYQDSKLGIFIHFGLYSYPGWAELSGTFKEVVDQHGWDYWFQHCSYAEWYHNTIYVPDSPASLYHKQTYGEDFQYQSFKPLFDGQVGQWDPNLWADLFQKAGAKYVVLTSKHHDGFQLWPSKVKNKYMPNYQANRDIVGELAKAVRDRGMTYGIYYSGGYDWTYKNYTLMNGADLFLGIPQKMEYVEYVDQQWRELIDLYDPYILWNDMGMPELFNSRQLFADYYNNNEQGVVNNRFSSTDMNIHRDFNTPEYNSYSEIVEKKWESTRGLGYSFGYNRNDVEDIYLSPKELVTSFIDIVSKNGNLLLNVGPEASGRIPEMQASRLRELGSWLSIYGESIYSSRYWSIPETKTLEEEIQVRFTQSKDKSKLYVHLFDSPMNSTFLTIPHVQVQDSNKTIVKLLGYGSVEYKSNLLGHIQISFPIDYSSSLAYSFSIEPIPSYSP